DPSIEVLRAFPHRTRSRDSRHQLLGCGALLRRPAGEVCAVDVEKALELFIHDAKSSRFAAERCAQCPLGAHQQGLDARYRSAKNGCCLRIAEALAIGEQDGGTLPFGQLRDSRGKRAIGFIALDCNACVQCRVGDVARMFEREEWRTPPSVEAEIENDAIEP